MFAINGRFRFAMRVLGALLTLSGTVLPIATAESEDLTEEQLRFFETKIRPVLVEHCYRCHSNEGSAVRGGLWVDSREGLRGGGESGPAVVPGDLESSLLWSALNYEEFEMPPGRQLPAATLADFRRWIEMGAPDPRGGEIGEVRSSISEEDIERGRQFWAFESPRVTTPPSTDRWPETDIDRYLRAAMQSEGLEPIEDADSEVVLRRLHFDLIGLPPEPARRRSFAADYRRDPSRAVAAEVDWLLAQPGFGERWARHWLDVARYAESSSSENELTFPHAWRYRDWVIDAFNQDKPYDMFIQQQIAGDLLPVDSDHQWAENLVATGFLALGPKTLIERNPRQFKADLVDEQIDVTTRAVLGVSVACARCHDHKFDPIPQRDYYALAGIFQSTETFFGGLSSRRMPQSSNLLILPVEDTLGTEPIDADQLAALRDELQEKREQAAELQREIFRLLRQRQSDTAGPNAQQRLQVQRRRLEREISLLQSRVNAYDESGQPLTLCMGVQDAEQTADTRLLARGEINQPTQTVPRGFVRVIGPGPTIPAEQSGRLQLARWLTDRDNPLTARVMMNRVWMHLMGEPLVAETDNFGYSGQPPTHPELLDHLAVEFMEEDWSVKAMIRQIATSRSYRLSSRLAAEQQSTDPENVYYWRAHRRRLPAESIRDAMLAVGGNLQSEPPAGSKIAELGTTVLAPGGLALTSFRDIRNAQPLSEFTANYRSIYLPIARGAVPRSLEVFDYPDPAMIVGEREESNTATQALYLLNNAFVIAQANAFAARLRAESSTPQERLALAFEIAYGREPTAEERRASSQFLRSAMALRQRDTSAANPSFDTPSPVRFARGDRRERLRRLIEARRGRGVATPAPLDPLAQFCHSLIASAEFRYLR